MITAIDVESIYEVPLKFHEEGLDRIVCELLDLEVREPALAAWRHVVDISLSSCVVGKTGVELKPRCADCGADTA